MARLFYALWPDAETRRALTRAADAVDVRDARRLHPDNLHLTVFFAGQVDAGMTGALLDAAEPFEAPPFELEFGTAGWWRKAAVAWLAPLETPPALAELRRELLARLAPLGFVDEGREYRPHVTIARAVKRAPRATGSVELRWKCANLALVESQTLASGACYTVRRQWPLGTS